MPHLSAPIEAWLTQYNQQLEELQESGFKPTPTNTRKGLAQLTFKFVTQYPEVAWIQDDVVPGKVFDVPVRLYHPRPVTALPVLIHFHGGGHMAGSVTVYDPICRKMALYTQHIVVSMDYRRSPEYPYPAAVQDAMQVTRNVWTLLDAWNAKYRQRLSIGGDSGGGALCATVAHLIQDEGDVAVSGQVLIYPSLDYTLSSESLVSCGTGYLLETQKIRWYFDHYFQHQEDRRAASPLFMTFSKNLPDTLVVTAGFCPLQDEGIAYAEKLKSAGVRCDHLHFDDMIHAFLNLEDMATSACEATYTRMDAFLNRGT